MFIFCETKRHHTPGNLLPLASVSRRKHKAWGASPRTGNRTAFQPVKRATAHVALSPAYSGIFASLLAKA